MKTHPKVVTPIIIDPVMRHNAHRSFVATSWPTPAAMIDNAVKAEEILSTTSSIYEESTTYWFSAPAMINKHADHMIWDDATNDRLITAEETDLNDLLYDNLDWTAKLDAVDISFKPKVKLPSAGHLSFRKQVSNNLLL